MHFTSPTLQCTVYCAFLNLVHCGIFKCKRKINSIWDKVCLISYWCLKSMPSCAAPRPRPPKKKSKSNICKQLIPSYDLWENGNSLAIKEVVCWRPFNHDVFALKMAQLVNIHTHICIIGFVSTITLKPEKS